MTSTEALVAVAEHLAALLASGGSRSAYLAVADQAYAASREFPDEVRLGLLGTSARMVATAMRTGQPRAQLLDLAHELIKAAGSA